ncbi:MAG: L,D-transpeptidase family protein [Pseudomonadota bacterium]
MTTNQYVATAAGKFSFGSRTCPCILGRGGVIDAEQKREGDGASPLGTWLIRRVFYRADRLSRPQTALPVVPLRPEDGWCDSPDHPLYNRPVRLPFPASHETLWREDRVYDVIVELGHNDDPVRANYGSAIFMHLMREDKSPTQGCIALDLPDMLEMLGVSAPGTAVQIRL